MDSYTITITPNDDSGSSTTLTVDTSTGPARITSVHMHAPAGLAGGQMPGVDVGLLLQAITGPGHSATAIAATPAPAPEATPEPLSVHVDSRQSDAGVDEPAAATANSQSAADDTAPQATGTAATPAKRTSPRRGRNQPTTKTAPRKSASKRAKTAAAAAGSGGERVYRRMPDDFAAVYRQGGTAAAIADHYGVPRYTAQGWIARLKKQDATS